MAAVCVCESQLAAESANLHKHTQPSLTAWEWLKYTEIY